MEKINKKVTVYGKVVGKQRARLGRGGKAYTPKATKEYETKIGREYMRFDGEKANENDGIMLELYVYLKKPKKSKFFIGLFPTKKKPDLSIMLSKVFAMD